MDGSDLCSAGDATATQERDLGYHSLNSDLDRAALWLPTVGYLMKLSDAQRRAFRTLLQVGTVQAVIVFLTAFHIVAWTTEQQAAVTTLATLVLAFVHNWLEDNTQMPALLKAVPSPGQNPVDINPPR